MEQKLLSIYVGNEVTRVCEVVKKSATMVVVNNATEVATPTGAVDDGYLTDVPAIAEAIRGCVFGRGFSASKVIFTISSKKIANKEVVIPYVRGDKKVAAILEANSSEYFPMSTTGDFLFAHSIMETFQDVEGKKLRLTAVAAPRDLVECYYELADELRLTVEDIDYVGNSVLQLLSLQMKEGDTELVLQIEKDMTFVNVMSGKSVILQRSVPYGKNAVINSMMEIKKLTEKEAKTLLSNRDMLDRQVTEEEYAEAVRYLISSIGRIVEYHRSRNPDRIIDGIRVFGEGSAIAGIDDVLRQELGAQVTHFSTLQGIKAGSKSYLTSETALRYLANFGAVLNPIGLNLNRGKSKENVSKTADKILYALLIVALLVTVGWTAWVLIIYYGKVAERDLLNAEIQKMEPIETLKAEYDAVVAEHAAYIAFDTATISENEQLLKFITDLERILPKDLIVNDLVATDGVVKFSVKAPNKEAVADMYVAVSELPYVKDVVLPSYMEEVGVIPSWEAELDDEGNVISLNGEEYVVDEEAVDYTYGGGITFVTYEFQCTLYGEVPAATTQEGGAQ
ncbi:MAG: pilus assembly protein PilM [Lachnospiraceae bacterium]|nr:pilus assembly protein PilM [Lachnospiraceae bacterium]